MRKITVKNQRSGEERVLYPGARVYYKEDEWEVWGLGRDGTVCLLRCSLKKKPYFKRVKLGELQNDRA